MSRSNPNPNPNPNPKEMFNIMTQKYLDNILKKELKRQKSYYKLPI